MATKLKSNRKIRVCLTVLFLAALVTVNLLMFPWMLSKVTDIRNANGETLQDEVVVDQGTINLLYHSCYALYAQSFRGTLGQENWAIAIENGHGRTKEEKGAWDLQAFFPDGMVDAEIGVWEPSASAVCESWLGFWDNEFWLVEDQVKYYTEITRYEGYHYIQTNTPWMKSFVSRIKDSSGETLAEQIDEEEFTHFLGIFFDKEGNMSVKFYTQDEIYVPQEKEHILLSEYFMDCHSQDSLGQRISEGLGIPNSSEDLARIGYQPIKNYNVYFGIPNDSVLDFVEYHQTTETAPIMVSIPAYALSAAAVILWMILMTSRLLWKDIRSFNRRGILYVAELGIAGIVGSVCLFTVYYDGLQYFDENQLSDVPEMFLALLSSPAYDYLEIVGQGAALAGILFLIFAGMYLSLLCLRPLFSLGLTEYVKQYSLIWKVGSLLRKGCGKIFRAIRGSWREFVDEVRHLNFAEKSTKTLVKLVLINFAVLLALICLWVFGLPGLVIYSMALFVLMRRFYNRIFADYQKLLADMNRVAEGDLSEPEAQDMGVFNPLQTELTRIRGGFSKAVAEELRSQKMKTELITNVSHDLKTPLTAITTYVELLKKEDITEEERASYVETLERKAFRLKVLIEDLFEVSKAQSENVTLNLMDVDLVNLMRQVAVEHQDKMAKMGLEIRWKVPEEKVTLLLDNQKTYRIFENLFGNIEKYAMPGSRVYIDVTQDDENVRVVMKNMSATELNVAAEELTERFVRGDESRNTEGSGLGLAIVRSFVELQKGELHLEVDGDLFKATLLWKR